MIKKLISAVAFVIATMGIAFAQVDVNKADQAALDGIKGIGPATSKAILDERKKGGAFSDWADLEKRVKGIGDKRSVRLSEAGLSVNGQPKSAATAAGKSQAKNAKSDAKKAKQQVKADATDIKREQKKEPKVALAPTNAASASVRK